MDLQNSFSAIKRLKEFLYLFLPLFRQWGRIEHLKHSILNFIWTSEHILNTSWSGCSFSTFISESDTQTFLLSIFDPTGSFSRTLEHIWECHQNICNQLRASWEHLKTSKNIWHHPENNWEPIIDSLVLFEQDFNTRTQMLYRRG